MSDIIKEHIENTLDKPFVYKILINGKQITWNNRTEKIKLIRKGLPFDAIEIISKASEIPVKDYLFILRIAKTTYYRKKNENQNLSKLDTEFIMLLIELFEFGKYVFNDNDKFLHWLKKTNLALGGVTPFSLFDTYTGIQEVKSCLDRIEYGNMA